MKIDYSKLFTLRADGRYQGYWHELQNGKPTGPRHTICDKNPERLYQQIQEKEQPRIPTFSEVTEMWKQHHVESLARGSQRTYRAPIKLLVDSFGKKKITQITSADIDCVLKELKERGIGAQYASAVRSVFKMIMDYAVSQKLIMQNPVVFVSIPSGMKRGHVEAPTEELEKIIKDNLDKPFGNFVALLLYTGMRTEEAAALVWADVDLENEFIYVRSAMDLSGTPKIKTTKTEAGTRKIPIPSPLKQYLVKPKKAHATDFVINCNGKPLTRSQITYSWIKWCRSAGLATASKRKIKDKQGYTYYRIDWKAQVTPHQLRHYYATVLYENEIDEMITKKVMGHSDISTTHKIYTSIRDKKLNEAYDKLKNSF